MIAEKDLLESIEICEGEPHTPAKISKLADLYIIYDHLFGQPYASEYSRAEQVETPILRTSSDTEFLRTIDGKPTSQVLSIIDEIMSVVQTLHPKMYDRMIDKLGDL